jgi:putative ABC transport system substrate-binding protein
MFNELRQHGYVEGESLAIDRRGFDARYDQFPTIVADLISASPDAILCGGDAAIRAVQAATGSIPVVAITDDGRCRVGSLSCSAGRKHDGDQHSGG